ncbi:MAG: type II toxin-antitoxin system RelE/ParE family toxin [Limisphaerales bacterium]
MKRITYLSVADIELVEAAQYYDEQADGLGRKFLDAVVEAGEKIRRNPELWSYFERPVRGFRVMPFPYRLLYRELPDRIQIIAVFHLSRRPGSWKDRLK